MNIFAAERAVGVMEVLCWDMRDGGVGGEGQGLLVRVAEFWCPCPYCSLGCPRKVRYATESAPSVGSSWEMTFSNSWLGLGKPIGTEVGSLVSRPCLSALTRALKAKEAPHVPQPATVFTSSGRASPSSLGAKSAGTFAPHPALLDARNALARGMLLLTTCLQEPRAEASLRSSWGGDALRSQGIGHLP